MSGVALSDPAATAPEPPETPFDVLVREPTLAAQRALAGPAPALVRTALVSLLVGGAIFGGVLGSYRGELQILSAAAKMPLALLGTLVATAPGVWAIGVATGRVWTLRSVGALVLVAAGRGALVLVALAPLLWLAIDLGSGYHFAAFLAAGVFGLAGLVGLAMLVRALGGAGGLVGGFVAAAIFIAALAQTGWALRPWLGRPSRPVQLVRVEVGVGPLESIVRSTELGMDDPTGRAIEGRPVR